MRRLGIAFTAGVSLLAAACEAQPATGPQGEEEPSAASGPVRVGLLYTISDIGGEFAQAALGASSLAVDDAKEDGFEIEVLDRDYAGSANRARQLADELATEGVAGIVVASDDPALAPALADFDAVPVVHALLPDDGAVDADAPTFRVAPSNGLQAEKLADYLVGTRGYDRVAILHEDTPFGTEGALDMERALSDQGAQVVMNQGFRVGADIHTPITHAGQLEADALILWTRDNGEAGRITIEIHKADQGYQLVLSGNLATFDYGKNAASQVTPVAFRDGILSVGTWAGPWFDLERMRGFYERFRELNNVEAPFQAVQVYDGILLLAQASREAGGADPAAMTEALEQTQDFTAGGVPISFAPGDHEGVGLEDMAILAFTRDQLSAGGEFAPDISTGGGFFTVDTSTVRLPSELSYLLEGLPA
ncbi:MAG TPA: ABC transporter substrate-binding protein [Actinomycetota bacterium]|nr:ABC transporter substrate-binding protein [Actinomycetota bacterium]